MKTIKFGKSVEGRDLVGYVFAKRVQLPTFLILATVHGDEIEGWWLADHFKNTWKKDFPYLNVQVVLVPEINPDGFALKTRTNASGVDLNRNLPTKDWDSKFSDKQYYPGLFALSEQESVALVGLIEKYKPLGILTLHSYSQPQINANGYEESGVVAFARALQEISSYKKITMGDEIGYATPGCLGTYAGYERGIPTVTYEMPRGASKDKILLENIVVIERAVEYFNNRSTE